VRKITCSLPVDVKAVEQFGETESEFPDVVRPGGECQMQQ